MKTRTAHIARASFGVMLTAVAVLGGVQGSAMAADTAAVTERVETFVVSVKDAQTDYATTTTAALIEGFQPTLDAATALHTSSDGKASAETRTLLNDAITSYTNVVAPQIDPRIFLDVEPTEIERLAAVRTAVGVATAQLDSLTKKVTDEVTEWQAAEDARIEAERIAAEEAARQAEQERRNSSGSNDSGNRSSGGSSNNGGSSNGGSSNSGRAWAEGIVYSIAPNVSSIVWDYTPAGGTYGGMHKGGVVYLSNSVADGSGYAYSIAVHEAVHAGPQRGSCYATWQGHFGGDAERFTQAYTLAHFGTTVGAYAYPTQADLDAARSC